jgi:type IX secretion system PorP/SprF family membrane protein
MSNINNQHMQKLIILVIFLCGLMQQVAAQDMHFSQFYAMPQALNPALTGMFEGRYRVSTIYRDQWRSVLDEPIQSFGVGGDFRFTPRLSKVQEDGFGAGITFLNDRIGGIDFNTTQIGVALAYHKSLDVNNSQYLSLGVQGAMVQRNVNYLSLNFHDEFDGVTGYTLGSGEEFPTNNFSFPDLNIGLNYTSKISRKSSLYAGVAYHHVLRPDVAFYSGTGQGDRLFSRYSAHILADFPVGGRETRVSMQPRIQVASQGPHMEINTGTNLRFSMGQYGTTAFHVGGWVRPVKNVENMSLDAAVVLLGFEINNVLIGMSYDLNLKAIGANQRQGAFEISVAYLGDFESEGIPCPKF